MFSKNLAMRCPNGVTSENYLAYQKIVDRLIEKATFLKDILSFLDSKIRINAYWTRGNSLYFAVCCPKQLPYVHPMYHITQNINLDNFIHIMEHCRTLILEEFSEEKEKLLQHLEDLETVYLEALTI